MVNTILGKIPGHKTNQSRAAPVKAGQEKNGPALLASLSSRLPRRPTERNPMKLPGTI